MKTGALVSVSGAVTPVTRPPPSEDDLSSLRRLQDGSMCERDRKPPEQQELCMLLLH